MRGSDSVMKRGLTVPLLGVLMLALWGSGCTKKADEDSSEAESVDPVELDLWAGVPALEAQAGDIPDKLVPKPGPAKPEQVGEEIEIPFPPPLSEEPPAGVSEQPQGPLEVLRFGPEGAQGLVEAIRVSFNHPMVPLASIEDLRQMPAPLTIEPAIDGEFRWMGTRTVAFYPTGRLPFSTDYTVTIPAGTKSTHGTELAKAVSWSIETPRLALEQSSPYDDQTHAALEQPLVLRFNQPVDADKIAAAASLSSGIELELIPASRYAEPEIAKWVTGWVAGTDADWQRARVVVLQPTKKLAPNKRYTLKLPPGVYGEGPAKSGAISLSFTTYPPLKLSESKCDPMPCSASYGINLEATNQLQDARVIDKVHVTPEVEDLEINAAWNGISMTGKFVGETTYTVTVDAGLRDVYGQELGKPYKAAVKLGPLERSLQVWPRQINPGIIEASAGHTIKIQVAGTRELEVMGASFNSTELKDYYSHRYHYEDEFPAGLGKPVAIQKLDVSDSRQRIKTLEIDVDDFVEGTDTFVFLYVRSEKYKVWDDYEDRQRLTQIVQLSNLGVTAAFDNDDGVVLVTDLASGAPVADAEVRIMSDSASRERWKGRTDAAGIARPALTGDSFYSPMLIARKGDDEVFMHLDEADLQGRWMSGMFGRAYESETRAFMFTERQPYKPGDTVHLVGILRRETRGPNGKVELWGNGATGKYKVTTPRGVMVKEGDVKIGAFGTFAVDIETDPNGDTGNYSFSLEFSGLFGKSHSFWHGFAVEDYRTPEFEVEVARTDSTPLYFGDTLEAEIRGRYLFGSPMVGAQASYTLTRQATSFRPPGDDLSDFHFAATPGRRWGGYGGFGGGDYYSWNWNPPEQIEAKSLVLDRKGVLKVEHALAQVEPKPPTPGVQPPPTTEPPKPPLPEAATFSIAAVVTDENRQAIAGSGSFVVHPSAYYVGLRSDRTVLQENQQTQVQAIVVDVDGKRVEGVDVSLRAVRIETTRKPIEKDGVWTFEYGTEETETSTCALSSGASPAACDVTVGKAGTHTVIAEVTDAKGRKNRAAIEIFVHGEDAVIWDKDQKRVDLVPDKPSYQPGDVAKILVRSPFDAARGFLVIERQGRKQTHELNVKGGVAVVEVEISEDMAAGVTASVVLSKPRTKIPGAPDDQDLGAPTAASGEVPLVVSKDLKTIAVDVRPSVEQVEPGGKIRVDVHTHTVAGEPLPAAVALFVVDEGVLNLMGYETPDPLSFFHYQRTGDVGLYANHPMVLPRNAAEQPKPADNQVGVPAQQPAAEPAAGDAYGMGGLGLVGTGRGGGGTGEGTIGLGNTGLIGKGGGGGTGSGYGTGAGAGFGGRSSQEERKEDSKAKAAPSRSRAPGAPPPPPAAPGGNFDANLAMAQEVKLRTLFATTAYFEAELVTDAEGNASVEIDMPENLTSYRIMAVAVDPAVHDRFGSGEASVRVRKTIMLRPSLPRFLNMGDQFEASVMVDNQSDATQTVLVGTRGLNVALAGETEKTVEIPPGESREVRFPMAVDKVGIMRLQFAAMSNAGRDATEIELPVLVPATKQAFADYGMTSTSVARAMQVPKDALPGFGGLEVSMSSTALNGLEDAVEFLVSYRYECSEQTASRILPIFALGKILDDFPIADTRDRVRRDALALDGINRLLKRQNYDGGFGYWGDDRQESWPYVSTWVTFALLEGKRAGYPVDQEKLDRALQYLEDYVRYGVVTRWGVYYDWTTRAFAVWLLSDQKRGSDLFDKVWAERSKLPLYARILMATAAHRYGRTGPVDEVLAELRERVVEGARTIHFAESKSEAGSSEGLSVLMHSNTQTDAIALMALLELGDKGGELGDDGMAPKIIAGLMSDRDPKAGGRWTTTHSNAWALLAASRYYNVMEAETPNFTAKIWLDELFAGEHAFVGRDMTKVNQQIPMADLLAEDVEQVTLGKDGPGKLYYRLGLRYAPADFEMKAVDRGFTVARRYEAIPDPALEQQDPDAVKQLDDGDWQIKAGTNVKVTLTLVAQDRTNYVVVDDPMPAGFEGQNPRFLTSVAATSQAGVDYGYGGGYGGGRGGRHYDDYGYGLGGYGYGGYDFGRSSFGGWWFPWFSFDHTQMRDDRMLLFADWLPAGVYTYSYTARATNLGTFILPPVHAEAMYEPEKFGHGSSAVVTIVE